MSTAIKPSEANILATGKVKSLFFKQAIPAVVAQVVNLLYNMVDRMYIGHMPGVGSIALTGIGVVAPLIVLITAFANLIGAGGAPRASTYLGAGEGEKANTVINQAASLAIVLGLLLTLVCYLALSPLLILLGASDNSLSYALEYARIYLIGTVAVMFSLGMNNFISVQGFAKRAMLTTTIGAVLNIILDPIFIFALNFGVAGAAIATVISQYVSAIWAIVFLQSEKSYLKLNLKKFTLTRKVALPILALGLSSFIMNSTESLLQMAFNRQLFRFGGDLYVATMAINGMIMTFITMPTIGFAQGAISLISYNYGARRTDRIKETIRILLLTNVSITLALTAVIQIFPQGFIRMFTGDAVLIETIVPTLRIYLAGIGFFGLQISAQQSLVAFGQAKLSAAMALFRKVVLLIPLIYILPQFMQSKIVAVYLAEPISDILATLVTTIAFFRFFKAEMRRLEADHKQQKGVK